MMEALRICKKCGLEAYTRDDLELFRRHKQSEYGRANICYVCYNEENKQRRKAWNMKNNYGITEKEYNEMLEYQNHRCAICDTDKPNGKGSWHIDHCHNTGKVRGLLCLSCNTALGHFKDDISIIDNAIVYLETRG